MKKFLKSLFDAFGVTTTRSGYADVRHGNPVEWTSPPLLGQSRVPGTILQGEGKLRSEAITDYAAGLETGEGNLSRESLKKMPGNLVPDPDVGSSVNAVSPDLGPGSRYPAIPQP